MNQLVKKILVKIPGMSKLKIGKNLYMHYKKCFKTGITSFMILNWNRFYLLPLKGNKADQVCDLLNKVDIVPVVNNKFFYSIDCYKTLDHNRPMLINYTSDYDKVVNSSFKDIYIKLKNSTSSFSDGELKIIDVLKNYIKRCIKDKRVFSCYEKQIEAINTIFERPAVTLFEALQRILFFNQVLWQTNHQHNGFGRLDFILDDIYQKELSEGNITREEAKELVLEFLSVLHEYYWFKSGLMLGDTGQIIIVGGIDSDNNYFYNDLTTIFIEAMMELKLPEPKVFLRCSSSMPDELLKLALKSMATGIGAPLLSNDDYIIPDLISFGYDAKDSYNYSASACWEPLVTKDSCDLNNIKSFNFAVPLINMLDSGQIEGIKNYKEFVKLYIKFLCMYIKETLEDMETLQFEEDPILSLVSDSSIKFQKDLTAGGAKYYNLGLTTVGIGTVVNSMLNIKKFIYDNKEYSLEELNKIRKNNYSGHDGLMDRLKKLVPCYGMDDEEVIGLVNYITSVTSVEFGKYSTKYGGKFKFGLSSPYYIEDANNLKAAFDGRKNGEPFNVHISANIPVPLTALFRFASKIDYSVNRFNGNVVDIIIAPRFLNANIDKFMMLIKTGLKEGIYQIQLNVVDSNTLIEAKKNPRLFPNLIVRVWGFSAYFNDLPEEYKNLLIKRAKESEEIA